MRYFAIATEGATCDGRTIDKSWIIQSAKNYDPKKYGARINCEHMRGLIPGGPFLAYGDVLALKAEKNDAGKFQLLAALDPTEELKGLILKRQKIYTSCEFDLDFADTKEAYLVGLAVTDSPASLSTEMLQFSASAAHSPLANRKERPGNVFTAGVETPLDFSEGALRRISDQVRKLLSKQEKQETSADEHSQDVREALELIATDNAELRDQLNQRASSDEMKALTSKVDGLMEKLSKEPANGYTRRAPATGDQAESDNLTDC